MAGRRLCSDQEAEARGFGGDVCWNRRLVLRETLGAFENCVPPERYHRIAAQNLARWRTTAEDPGKSCKLAVVPADWGVAVQSVTKKYGACFAVLNMANAYVPGGAYVEGAAAQEENMFRRTDCHFHVTADQYEDGGERYVRTMTDLISGSDGRVYLDTNEPRVCIRGP